MTNEPGLRASTAGRGASSARWRTDHTRINGREERVCRWEKKRKKKDGRGSHRRKRASDCERQRARETTAGGRGTRPRKNHQRCNPKDILIKQQGVSFLARSYLPGEHLPEHHTHRIDVALGADVGLGFHSDDLGGHPRRRAYHVHVLEVGRHPLVDRDRACAQSKHKASTKHHGSPRQLT